MFFTHNRRNVSNLGSKANPCLVFYWHIVLTIEKLQFFFQEIFWGKLMLYPWAKWGFFPSSVAVSLCPRRAVSCPGLADKLAVDQARSKKYFFFFIFVKSKNSYWMSPISKVSIRQIHLSFIKHISLACLFNFYI